VVVKEIWKDLIGYRGLYRVSNLGSVHGIINGQTWRHIV
jgi:hypothetical protein